MRESMSTIRYKIFFMISWFSCSTRFLILRIKKELLSGKIDLWKRWHLACYIQIHFHNDYGLKHLLVQPTSKTYLPIDISRIRPPTRLGVASNQKRPTSAYSVLVQGFPMRRGRHLIHRAQSVYLLDTLTVWRDTNSWIFPQISSSLSVVSNSRKVSHMYLSSHM